MSCLTNIRFVGIELHVVSTAESMCWFQGSDSSAIHSPSWYVRPLFLIVEALFSDSFLGHSPEDAEEEDRSMYLDADVPSAVSLHQPISRRLWRKRVRNLLDREGKCNSSIALLFALLSLWISKSMMPQVSDMPKKRYKFPQCMSSEYRNIVSAVC